MASITSTWLGGQLIILVADLDMVVVVTADPLYGQTGAEPWRHEKANINFVADFAWAITGQVEEGENR